MNVYYDLRGHWTIEEKKKKDMVTCLKEVKACQKTTKASLNMSRHRRIGGQEPERRGPFREEGARCYAPEDRGL